MSHYAIIKPTYSGKTTPSTNHAMRTRKSPRTRLTVKMWTVPEISKITARGIIASTTSDMISKLIQIYVILHHYHQNRTEITDIEQGVLI